MRLSVRWKAIEDLARVLSTTMKSENEGTVGDDQAQWSVSRGQFCLFAMRRGRVVWTAWHSPVGWKSTISQGGVLRYIGAAQRLLLVSSLMVQKHRERDFSQAGGLSYSQPSLGKRASSFDDLLGSIVSPSITHHLLR